MIYVDVFVSFSSADVQEIRPIVEALRAAGLTVWWSDDSIPRGTRYDREIESALEAARHVIAFMSPAADESTFDFIYEEIERARRARKLLPVVIADGGRSFAMKAMSARIQNFAFGSFEAVLTADRFQELVSHLAESEPGVATADKGARMLPPRVEGRDVEAWYDEIERRFGPAGEIRVFANTLACAFFEDGRLAAVQRIAVDLAAALSQDGTTERHDEGESFPRRTTGILDLIGAERSPQGGQAGQVAFDTVRFRDRQRGSDFLRFAWSEFPERRPVIERWLHGIVADSSIEERNRIGFALGLLGQSDLIEVFAIFGARWLRGGSEPHVDAIDMALAVAAYDPSTANALHKRILEWARSSDRTEQALAVRLACGLTGARLPGSAVDVLRVVTERQTGSDLIEEVEKGLRRQLDAQNDESDTSLLNLRGLFEDLFTWVREGLEARGRHLEDTPLPFFVVVVVLSGIALAPTRERTSRITLETLMSEPEIAFRIAWIFAMALRRYRIGWLYPRKLVEEVLHRWIDVLRTDATDGTDAVAELLIRRRTALLRLAALMHCTSPEGDDKHRVEHLFRRIFAPSDLATLPAFSPHRQKTQTQDRP